LTDDFIHKLKENNPIESIMASYTQLIRQGHDYVCLCPFHSEKTPSCRVYTNDQHFYCYGCGAGGDVITFIKRAENLEYMEAVKLLAQKSGIQIPDNTTDSREAHLRSRVYQINRETARFFYRNLISGVDKRGLMYFASRKLKPQTVKKYGLGYAPDSWDTLYKYLKNFGFSDYEITASNLCRVNQKNNSIYDFFRNRVMFPIIDLRGNIIAFGGRVLDNSLPKYMNSSDTPVFKKSRNLFSLNFAKNAVSERLILAEGYMDVIALNQAGFENTVATLGTALTQEQARIMANYAKEVVIAYDSDNAGQNATHKAINLLGNVGITTKIIKMEGAKDPDEYIKKFGPERFRLLIEQSDGAVNFELAKCREGLDMFSETGKVEFLRRASNLLANISNPLERNVYISKTANECDIEKDVLTSYVNSQIKRKSYSENKIQWQTVKNIQNMHDKINPDADSHPKESRAEELIIIYILRNPDSLEEIYEKLPPEKFITEFNRRIYECILKKSKNSSDFSISLFSDEFNNEEMGRITGLGIKNKEIDVNYQTVTDCIKVISECYDDKKKEASTFISDEQLIELQRKLINMKQEE
jgi:DNA primase